MGLGLFAQNMVPYAKDFFILFIMGSQILFGNNLYPIALRYIIWFLKKTTKSDIARQEYSFLLLNSRECFTNLFPAMNTQILFMIVAAFNIFQWISYLALDWHSGLFGDLTPWERAFSALFQSISTRAAGFNVYDLSKLIPSLCQ
jgi:Trk-type K+ transport system membrane component